MALGAIYYAGGWDTFRGGYLAGNMHYVRNSTYSIDFFEFLRSSAEFHRFPTIALCLSCAYLCYRLYLKRKRAEAVSMVEYTLAAASLLGVMAVVNSYAWQFNGAFSWLELIFGLAAAVVALFALRDVRRGAIQLTVLDWVAAAVVVSLVTAAFAIITPHRPYTHYFNLMIVPAGLLYAILYLYVSRDAEQGRLTGLLRTRWAVPAVFLFLSVVCVNVTKLNGVFGTHQVLNRLDRVPAVLGDDGVRAIVTVTQPGELLAVWGEQGLSYETALIPAGTTGVCDLRPMDATNDAIVQCVHDWQSAHAPVFVDVVGPGRQRSDRSRWGYEVAPLMREYIDHNYRLICDADGYRVFVSTERLARVQ
jgi:hypothetical protein